MKKFISILLLCVMLFVCDVNVFADTVQGYEIPVTISVNGNIIETENAGIIYNDRTYAPIRFVANALRIYDIGWNDTEQSATLNFNGKTLKLFVEKDYAYLNGVQMPIEDKVILRNDRTLVPVRFLSEIFDCAVEWDSQLYIANILSNVSVPQYMIETSYTKDDILWLGRIIEAESSGEPFIGKIAVGNVILNRVDSSQFPDTIYGVIFDRKYGVQFQPVMNNTIYNTPTDESIIAGKIALTKNKVVGKSLYFLNPKTATNNWIIRNRVFYKRIQNHDFYL